MRLPHAPRKPSAITRRVLRYDAMRQSTKRSSGIAAAICAKCRVFAVTTAIPDATALVAMRQSRAKSETARITKRVNIAT